VRRDDDVGELPERAVDRQRFGGEHVEPRTAEVSVEQAPDQRLLVDDLAAADVDEPRAGAHRSESVGIEQTAGLVGERCRHGDGVGPAEYLGEPGRRPRLARFVAGGCPAEATHLHAERSGEARRLGTDRAEAHDAQSHPVEIDRSAWLPLTRRLVAKGLREVAAEREEVGQHGLGDRRRGGAGAVGDRHATAAEL